MFDFFEGLVAEINPAYVVINCNGVGYQLHISIFTYEQLKDKQKTKIFAHLSVKEDSHTLFGFSTENERNLFKLLITVNGVGPSTARMVLSSFSPDDITSAIISGNVSLLKSVKGVGPKTAQRIVIDLQDKMGKVSLQTGGGMKQSGSYQSFEEALKALQALGFARNQAEKALLSVTNNNTVTLSIEDMIKKSLKIL